MKSVKINETEIRYDFKPAKQDRKHLVVIFSGFRKMGTFDFGGRSLSNLGAAVLWIDDNFGDNYSYYIRAYGGRDISCDINTFIVKKLDELGLQLNQCTVAGFSKGASAALYYAAKFGYRNIVATVPQMRIGAYIEENWTECIKSMTGDTGSDGLRSLDRIIPDLITSCDTNKNLYLFTSPDDIQYKDEIVPFLPHFRKFVNFNLITTSSPLVTEHKLVTPYNLPLIVAIFAMLSDGISPRLGEISNGAGYKVSLEIPTSSNAGFMVGISALKIDMGRFFIDGYAVADGYSAPTWGVQSTYIHFRGPESHRVRLGQVVDNTVNSRSYREPFVDYSHAGFSTIKHEGIDISSWAPGRYKISISCVNRDVEFKEDNFLNSNRTNVSYYDGKVFKSREVDGSLELFIVPLRTASNVGVYFEEVNTRYDEGKLFVEGYLVPRGRDVASWGKIKYFLELCADSGGDGFYIPIACDSKVGVEDRTGDIFNDQSKAYYATLKYQGLDLPGINDGDYRIRIIGDIEEQIIASPHLSKFLRVKSDQVSLVEDM